MEGQELGEEEQRRWAGRELAGMVMAVRGEDRGWPWLLATTKRETVAPTQRRSRDSIAATSEALTAVPRKEGRELSVHSCDVIGINSLYKLPLMLIWLESIASCLCIVHTRPAKERVVQQRGKMNGIEKIFRQGVRRPAAAPVVAKEQEWSSERSEACCGQQSRPRNIPSTDEPLTISCRGHKKRDK